MAHQLHALAVVVVLVHITEIIQAVPVEQAAAVQVQPQITPVQSYQIQHREQ
jgi:hypothetical protein